MKIPFEVKVERVIPGGKGLAFLNKRAVFIPLVAPGDRVQVNQFIDRGGYLEVLGSKVVEESSQRQSAPCFYFGTCGGCDFQHISYQNQLLNKRDILRDALVHVGKIQVSTSQIGVLASYPLAYRNRLQLKILRQGKTFSWGFFQGGSHQVCPIDSCLIARDSIWEMLPELKRFLENSPLTLKNLIQVEVFQGDATETLVDLRVKQEFHTLDIFKRELRTNSFDLQIRKVNVFVSFSQKQRLRVVGPGYVRKTVGAFRYRVSRGAFFQVNDFMLEPLLEAATKGLHGATALDLYCGVGFFTLPLTRSFSQVLAVDQNPSAILDIQKNIKTNGIRNCRLFNLELDAFLRIHKQQLDNLDLLLLDPPRKGIPKQTVKKVVELNVSKVVYVSCDPSMLARDLAIFLRGGYSIMSLEILDLFPQSHHMETVARLERRVECVRANRSRGPSLKN